MITNWRKWLKLFVLIIYTIIICISLPFIIMEFQNKNPNSGKEAWFIGGMFVIGAVPISLWTIMEHVINYTKPYLQRHIIRILWMVPIYALNAWFALRFHNEAIYLDTLRECYEAYVIYNFMAFLLNFLKHDYPDFGYMIEQKSPIRPLCPFCCCPKWKMGRSFINRCRHGVLQYTLVRPITTLIAFICEMAGVYHMNQFRIDGAYLYLNIINNISQIWAMYSLIMFYRCTRTELKPLKPFSKFVCVKFVVFLSFWQSVLFAILTWTKVIDKIDAWKLYEPEEISSIFQNFFICIEMFLAAIAHHYSFSVAPYRTNGSGENLCCYSCLAMCDLSDVKRDMAEHVRHMGKTVKSKVLHIGNTRNGQGLSVNEDNEVTPLIVHEGDNDENMENRPLVDINQTAQFSPNRQQHPCDRKYSQESLGSVGSSLLLDRDGSGVGVGGGSRNALIQARLDHSRASMNNQLSLSQSYPTRDITDSYGTSVTESQPVLVTVQETNKESSSIPSSSKEWRVDDASGEAINFSCPLPSNKDINEL